MNKEKFLKIIIFFLILLNVLLITFMINKHKRPFNPDGPRHEIIKRLAFDQKQIEKYDILIASHRKSIKENDFKIISLKQALYAHLTETKVDSSMVDTTTKQIAEIQKAIELSHFNHFKAVKALCTPKQEELFKSLALDLQNIFDHQKRMKLPKK